MRCWVPVALAITALVSTEAEAAPTCTSVGSWTYAGSGKGIVFPHADDKSATLDFTPDDKTPDAEATFVMAVDAGAPGTYQVNADFDVKHLTNDGLFTLAGATSAIPGRTFDVTIAKGDDGSSSFSRPVTATGRRFRIELHTKGAVTISVRNVKLCKLR